MSRYIVTGGCGFIGHALVDLLKQAGHEVFIASRGVYSNSRSGWVEYDLLRPQTIANLLSLQADGVFHLAWSSVPGSAEHMPGVDVRANVAGSVELFSALQKAGLRTLFLSSGGTVYGRTTEFPISEEHPANPIGIYGMGKLAAEQYAGLLQRTDGFDVRIARLSNPYGVNINLGRAQGAASVFARQIIAKEEVCLMGDGSVVRDYIDVENAVRALYLLMQAELVDVPGGAVFNIGSGTGLTLAELISLLEEIAGVKAKIRRVNGRPFDVPYNVLSIGKISSIVDWRPSTGIREGLTQLVDRIRDEIPT